MITTWPDGTPMSQGNAFTSVPPRGVDKPCTAPKKRGPKLKKSRVEQSAIALETHEERKARQFKERQQKAIDQKGRVTVDLAPRKTGAITIYSQADQIRNRAIRAGRAI